MVQFHNIALFAAVLAAPAALAAPSANVSTTESFDTASLDKILAAHKAEALAAEAFNSTTNATALATRDESGVPVTGVYFCTKPNYKGHCKYVHGPLQECHNLNSKFSDKVSSFGPEKTTWYPNVGNYHCLLYWAKNCDHTKPYVGISYPGSSDLLRYLEEEDPSTWQVYNGGTSWIDETVKSWKCVYHN